MLNDDASALAGLVTVPIKYLLLMVFEYRDFGKG